MQNNLPLVSGVLAFIIFLLLVIAIQIYNEAHYNKYKKLTAYLREHHPDIYEQIRIKPVLGLLYPKGAFKISIDYAKSHPPTNDPVAEKLFSDYAEFSQFIPTAIDKVVKDTSPRISPHIKAGIIAGLIGFVISGLVGQDLCFELLISIVVGSIAGVLTMRYENVGTREGASRSGAISGSIAGIFVFGGQMLGGIFSESLSPSFFNFAFVLIITCIAGSIAAVTRFN